MAGKLTRELRELRELREERDDEDEDEEGEEEEEEEEGNDDDEMYEPEWLELAMLEPDGITTSSRSKRR